MSNRLKKFKRKLKRAEYFERYIKGLVDQSVIKWRCDGEMLIGECSFGMDYKPMQKQGDRDNLVLRYVPYTND